MKNSFVKKLGLTAASAAVFGLVSSGVFISVNGVYDKVSAPAAQEAGAVAGESSVSGTTIGNAMNDNSVTTAEADANAAGTEGAANDNVVDADYKDIKDENNQ